MQAPKSCFWTKCQRLLELCVGFSSADPLVHLDIMHRSCLVGTAQFGVHTLAQTAALHLQLPVFCALGLDACHHNIRKSLLFESVTNLEFVQPI